MTTVLANDVADLVAGTLQNLGPNKFQQIAQSLTDYEVLGKWLTKDNVQFGTGRGIQRNLLSRTAGVAGHVGLFDTDSGGIPDLMDQMNVTWVHAQTKWAFERRMVLMNSGDELVFNIIIPQRTAALIDLADVLESAAWSVPSSPTDKLAPNGIPYYIVYNATTGFTGGAATGHTTVAGVNLTDSPNYKNYNATYTTISKSDLIAKMRTARRAMAWKSPVKKHDYTTGAGRNLRIYTDEAGVSGLEEIGEGQNENLGRDLAPYGTSKDVKYDDGIGEIVFRGHPIIRVDAFDNATTGIASGPFYLVDHTTFKPVVLKGDYLVESKPIMAPNNHNLWRVFVDLTYQYLCFDRRRNGLLATGA